MSLFKKIVVLMVLSLGCEHKKFLNPYDPINLPPAPELQHPEDNFVSPDNPPFFQWDLKEDTLNPFYGSDIIYEIQISTDSNFFSALFLSMITDYKIYLPSKLFCDSIYYWRVRARYLETDWGEWSKVNKFKVRFPVVGALSIPPHSNDMIIHQNYAFIAYAPGLFVIDITNPSNPQKVCSYFDTISQFSKIAIKEHNLYAVYGYRLGEYDIHNASAPLPKRYLTLPVSARDLTVWGDFVFLTTMDETYKIVITDPDSLYIVDSIPCSGSLIETKDDHLYVLNLNLLYIIKVSNNEVKVKNLPGTANSLFIYGNYCYIAGQEVWIYNIVDPSNPVLITSIDKSADAISASGNFLFFTTREYPYQNNVLYFYDISNISVPQYLATIKYCWGLISTRDNYVYLTMPILYVIRYE